MRRPIKIGIIVVLVLAVLAALAGGGAVYYLKLKWSTSSGVQSTRQDWLKHWITTPAVFRNMPLPGLVGEPYYFYYCEGDNVEINHLHFSTSFSREDVLKVLEPYLERSGYTRSGPNFVGSDGEIHIELTKPAGETSLKVQLFMKRK